MVVLEKAKKDLDDDVIPQLSRLCDALRRIALAKESSSVSVEPSSATVCRQLRRVGVNPNCGRGAGSVAEGGDDGEVATPSPRVSTADSSNEAAVRSVLGTSVTSDDGCCECVAADGGDDGGVEIPSPTSTVEAVNVGVVAVGVEEVVVVDDEAALHGSTSS